MIRRSKRFQTQVETANDHIATLRIVIAILVVVIAGMWYGWSTSPERLTVHVPPDLRTGADLPVGDIPHPNVYIFADHIFQQLQRWETNGDEDYRSNIYRLQYFITPRFRAWLEGDFQTKYARGELRNKQRAGQKVDGATYEPRRVQVLGDGSWIVWLDYEIREWVGSTITKTVEIRYPLRVVHFDIDRESNPWGLALDGYPDGLVPRDLDDVAAQAAPATGKGG